jgi:pyruvate/2-oxoglutarate dehydrogenase complex dihydrolipoamide acyltransferase (E2) component
MDLSTIPGTGEHGRITLDDVKVALYPIIKQKGDSITMVTKESTPPLQSSGSPEISFATPMARVTARKENLELSMVKGTGVAGRITLDDVKNAVTKLNAKGNGKNQQESRTKGKHCK